MAEHTNGSDQIRILVVEDDEMSAKVLRRFLAPFGSSDHARDGEEALEMFRSAHRDGSAYEVIFLDLMMPRADGHTVLRTIREFEKTLPKDGAIAKVIIVSALCDSRNVISAFQDGCEGYLTKPIQKARVFQELKTLGFGDPPPK